MKRMSLWRSETRTFVEIRVICKSCPMSLVPMWWQNKNWHWRTGVTLLSLATGQTLPKTDFAFSGAFLGRWNVVFPSLIILQYLWPLYIPLRYLHTSLPFPANIQLNGWEPGTAQVRPQGHSNTDLSNTYFPNEQLKNSSWADFFCLHTQILGWKNSVNNYEF
jgi:hypothetical protein